MFISQVSVGHRSDNGSFSLSLLSLSLSLILSHIVSFFPSLSHSYLLFFFFLSLSLSLSLSRLLFSFFLSFFFSFFLSFILHFPHFFFLLSFFLSFFLFLCLSTCLSVCVSFIPPSLCLHCLCHSSTTPNMKEHRKPPRKKQVLGSTFVAFHLRLHLSPPQHSPDHPPKISAVDFLHNTVFQQ